MKRKIKTTRRGKIRNWIKQRGGFVFTIGGILAAISAAVASSAPAIATGAITAASAYATSKLLKQAGGSRQKNRRLIRR
jgi:hypothetical protein